MGKNIVHVIGTGTIGEPLVGLLAIHREEFGIDEVTFHKNMPYSHDRQRSRNRGLLLHATGRQFVAVFDRPDVAVVGSGQPGRADRLPTTVSVPGDLGPNETAY